MFFPTLSLLTSLCLSQQTSKGQVSSEIFLLGSQLSELSSSTASSLSSLNTKLESYQDYSSDGSDYLLSSRIYDLNSDLSSVSSTISILKSSLAIIELDCKGKSLCESCSASDSCVWCPIEKKCVEGDAFGPFNGDCAEFLFENCAFPACERYKDCEECISDTLCGWCSIGHTCYEATSLLKGECEFEFFYHSEGNTNCPAYTSRKAQTGANNDAEVLKQEIYRLERIQGDIQAEIGMINEAKEDIAREANKKIEIPRYDELSDYNGIIEYTDTLAKEEKLSEENSQNENWKEFTNSVQKGTQESAAETSEEVIESLKKYQIDEITVS